MNKKFTLIELMVVIAIIGILVSMLIPSLAKSRNAARKAVCISNLKQTSLRLAMYADDNEDTYPPSKNGEDGTITWDDLIVYSLTDAERLEDGFDQTNHAVANDKSFECPSDSVERLSDQLKRSYSMNWAVSNKSTYIKISDIFKPSHLIEQMGVAWGNNIRGKGSRTSIRDTKYGADGWQGPDQHMRSGHYLYSFTDGHVQFLHYQRAVTFALNE
jgi:prepilin-type N-terminal cleavage/methylation domain-containing protein